MRKPPPQGLVQGVARLAIACAMPVSSGWKPPSKPAVMTRPANEIFAGRQLSLSRRRLLGRMPVERGRAPKGKIRSYRRGKEQAGAAGQADERGVLQRFADGYTWMRIISSNPCVRMWRKMAKRQGKRFKPAQSRGIGPTGRFGPAQSGAGRIRSSRRSARRFDKARDHEHNLGCAGIQIRRQPYTERKQTEKTNRETDKENRQRDKRKIGVLGGTTEYVEPSVYRHADCGRSHRRVSVRPVHLGLVPQTESGES